MKEYICSVCGYTYEGEDAPEKCPVCRADKVRFRAVAEGTNQTPEDCNPSSDVVNLPEKDACESARNCAEDKWEKCK